MAGAVVVAAVVVAVAGAANVQRRTHPSKNIFRLNDRNMKATFFTLMYLQKKNE